jgi:predicted ester cyclase
MPRPRPRPTAAAVAAFAAACCAALQLSAGAAASAAAAAPALAPAAPAAQPVPADLLKANKAVVRRYLVDVLGGAHPEAAAQLVAKGYRDRTPGAPEDRGPAAVRAALAKVHEMFSRVDYLVQELVAEDDRVVARYVVQATPRLKTGALPVAPVIVNGITIFKLAGGKIQETWIMNDQLNMLRQLGFAVSPAAPSSAPPAASATPGARPPANPGAPPAANPGIPPAANRGVPPAANAGAPPPAIPGALPPANAGASAPANAGASAPANPGTPPHRSSR